jgi:hypothetical protein
MHPQNHPGTRRLDAQLVFLPRRSARRLQAHARELKLRNRKLRPLFGYAELTLASREDLLGQNHVLLRHRRATGKRTRLLELTLREACGMA